MTAQELREYFDGRRLPEGSHKINQFGTVVDFDKYVQANIEGIETDPNPFFKPCMMRLIELRDWLEGQNPSH